MLKILGMLAALATMVTAIARFRRGVLCGAELSEALALVCDNFYYSPTDHERTLRGVLDSKIAFAFLRRSRRQSTGVADECCRKSCTYQELIAYCGALPAS